MRNQKFAYDEARNKLEEYCIENGLLLIVDNSKYPMTFSFYRQDMPLLEGADNEVIIRFKFGEEMFIEMDNARKLSISESVFNKIKTMSKEACRLYMLYAFDKLNKYYHEVFEPMWTTAEGDVVGVFKCREIPDNAKRPPAYPFKYIYE